MAVYYPTFSYRGIPCEQMGLYWLPDAKASLESTAEYNVMDESVTGRPGKYWYDTISKEREFVFDCFFENLSKAEIEHFNAWTHRSTSGELVLGDRPWCHYNVRPTKKITGEEYKGIENEDGEMRYSGKIQITFTAYDPFAVLDKMSYLPEEEDTDEVKSQKAVTGAVRESIMPKVSAPVRGTFLDFNLYNPGIEKTNRVKIKLKGTIGTGGQTITNYTTGEVCKLISVPSDKTLVIDTYSGTVTYEENGEYAFSCHNYGYISLEGCGMFRRDVSVRVDSENSTVLSSVGKFYKGIDKGLYISVGPYDWQRILAVPNANEAVISDSIPAVGTYKAVIAQHNQLRIAAPGGMDQSTFTIDYAPLIR